MKNYLKLRLHCSHFQLFFYSKKPPDIYLKAYIQSVPYHIGLSLRFKDKNKHIIIEKPNNICKKLCTMAYDFKNDSFSFNFPITRENRNLEPITIRYDAGHPVHKGASRCKDFF